MQLAAIRGTRAQVVALRGTVRHLHDTSRRIGPDRFEIPAVLSDAEISQLTAQGLELVLHGELHDTLSRHLAPPRISTTTDPADLLAEIAANSQYLPTSYVESWADNLAAALPNLCTSVPLPYPTWEGRTVTALHLRAGSADPRPSVLFTCGMHAGELGSTDIAAYFVSNLVNAYLTNSPIVLGDYGLPAEHVQDILEHLQIVIVPCVNPDGRTYVETTQNWWRKNRNPNVGSGQTGVDVNRNFDFLWSSGMGSSTDPSDDEYRGPAPFSEPETRNVQWLISATGARVYIDIHGPSGLLVYPWGDAPDQSTDPSMSFQNSAWDGKRADQYKEYIDPRELFLLQSLGGALVSAANAVRGGAYGAEQSFDGLYPTTATSDDFAYSRHLLDSSQPATYAYTYEFAGGNFIPDYAEMQNLAAEANAGMLALCDTLLLNNG